MYNAGMGIYVDSTNHDHIKQILISAGFDPDDLIEMSGRTSQEVGERWEAEFVQMSLARGLSVYKGSGKCDYIVNNYRIQCKASDCISRPVVPIAETSNATRKTGCRYEVGDWDYLAIWCPFGIYIVHADYVEDQCYPGFIKTTFNPRKHKTFLNAWDQLEV